MATKRLCRGLIPILGCCTLFGNPALPAAAPPSNYEELKTVKVEYADLDLTRPSDVRELYRRIRAAARLACGPLNEDPGNLPHFLGYKVCFAEAIDDAVGRMDVPALTALHRSSDGAQVVPHSVVRDRPKSDLVFTCAPRTPCANPTPQAPSP